jgi:hypothetical protein
MPGNPPKALLPVGGDGGEPFSGGQRGAAAATEAAVARRSFKKAAGYAERLLRLDPINSTARRVLIQAHLAHARKLTAAGRLISRARSTEAAGLEREGARSGVVQMGWGMMETLAGRVEEGEALIAQGLQLAGGGVLAYFKWVVEAMRLKLDPERQGVFQQRLTESVGLGKAEVLALIGLVNSFVAEDVKGLDQALDRLLTPLTSAARQDYSEEEMRAICECWHRAGHYGLLETYTEAALKRWEHRPLFVYYQVFARARRELPCFRAGRRRLEQAYEDTGSTRHPHRPADRGVLAVPAFCPLAPTGAARDRGAMFDLLEQWGLTGCWRS